MSIVINGTTESIQVVLDAAPSTNQLPCTASFADQNGNGGDTTINTNGTTPVTLVAAPGASIVRAVNSVSIPNRDTATRIVTVNKLISGTPFQIVRVTLVTGSQLYYENSGGWRVLDTNGNFLEAVMVVSGTITANQGGAPWSQNITQWGSSATSLGQKVMASSVPVTISSDQSAISTTPATYILTSTMQLTTTTPGIFGSTSTLSKLRFLKVDLAGYSFASSNTILVKDGAGNALFNITIPAIATALTSFSIWFSDMLYVNMNNALAGMSVALGSAPTSGSVNIQAGASG